VSGSRYNAARAGLLVAAVGASYLPSRGAGWIWDNSVEVTGNASLHAPGALARIWTGTGFMDYLPLKASVQWVEWRLWGPNPMGYHAFSVALHALAALLLWRVFSRLGLREAWLGALLFAVHPLAVESVAWVAEMKNPLSLVLLLLSFLMYLRWDALRNDEGGNLKPESKTTFKFQLSAFIFFLASLLSKSSVVMFPVVLLLHAWWKRARVSRSDLAAIAPFAAVSLALGLVTVWFQSHRAIEDLDLGLGGPISRVAVAGRSLIFYLGKAVCPAGLLPAYPRWSASPVVLLDLWPWLAAGVAAAALIRVRRPWSRGLVFGGGVFLANLLPVLGLVPMAYQRFSWVADHLAYLPLAGLAGLAAAGVGRLPSGRWIGAAAALALGAATFAHAGMYHDERTLWSRTLGCSPDSWLAENNLGDVVFRAEGPASAIPHFRRAVALNPAYPEAQANLGVALAATGSRDEGIAHTREAIRLKHDFPMAEYNLGLALHAAGRREEALEHLVRASRLSPGMAGAHNAIGVILAEQGRTKAAIAQFREALRLDPANSEARNNLRSLGASALVEE
jgi:protein O-mannosyl-transferase